MVLARFFHWQIINGDRLYVLAQGQRFQISEIIPSRGKIYTADDYPLVLNKPAFSLYAYLPNIDTEPNSLAKKLAPLLAEQQKIEESTQSAIKDYQELVEEETELIKAKLSSGKKWLILKRTIGGETKETIEAFNIKGLGFQQESDRDYPEASMAAHLLGFVGLDKNSKPKGYFGLEGFYNQQLSGASGLIVDEKNVFGKPIFSGKRVEEAMQPGLNLALYLERPAQFILEKELKKGIEKYQAKSGWGLILEPFTGGILAMANFPGYDPRKYSSSEEELFSNPIVAEGFEPGSIFKPIVMAAALEKGVVKPETKCSFCHGPKRITDHEIKTWNNQYRPNPTMKEVIQYSDNIGMVFVSEKLGKKNILAFLKKFGFDQKTGIDLQGEASLSIRPENQWYPLDLATVSFGQGISITPIQITRAFAALANGGKLIKPRVVKKVWSDDNKIELVEKRGEEEIISPETTDQIREMLVNAVENGEAKWIKPERLVVAGKTGTAQIPIRGHYDEEKTIASFIGFAPANDPKFVMLISLREPGTSPWGSETAAPVWFSIADQLAYLWNLL